MSKSNLIIRDAEMPEACGVCPCFQIWLTGDIFEHKCGATKNDLDPKANGRPDWCPLFEVKRWEYL